MDTLKQSNPRMSNLQRTANLIAAAPDMLAALKALVERMEESFAVQREGVTGGAYSVRNDDGTQWVDEFALAEAAIAKAEGTDA